MNETNSLKQETVQVLDFWLRELTPRQWFGGRAEVDAMVRQRFAQLLQRAKRNEAETILGYAKSHTSIVERFGRFPHRNKILGRVSTAEEEAFLVSGENKFA